MSTKSSPIEPTRDATAAAFGPDAVIGRIEEGKEDEEDGIERPIDGRLVSTNGTSPAAPSDSESSEESDDFVSSSLATAAEGERKAKLALAPSKSDLDLGDEIKMERMGGDVGGGDVPLTTSEKLQINFEPPSREDVRRLVEVLMWPKVVVASATVAAVAGVALALALWCLSPGNDRDDIKSFADEVSSFLMKP